jgi:spore coat polysaccharide biosynthesis protein SpsF (cytidylyltransferase family)
VTRIGECLPGTPHATWEGHTGEAEMTSGIIISARMSSKRFPGKVLASLGGRSVLEWVIERAKLVPCVDKVICAFPVGEESEPIARQCARLGVLTASGSESDVLSRFYDAAVLHKLDYIVRITADCPLINPILCGEVLSTLVTMKLDYVTNAFPKRTFAKGLDCEAFTFRCLEAAHLTTQCPYDREHVTPWMQRSLEVTKVNLTQKEDCSEINLCVDYPEDIQRLELEILHHTRDFERIMRSINRITAKREPPYVKTC